MAAYVAGGKMDSGLEVQCSQQTERDRHCFQHMHTHHAPAQVLITLHTLSCGHSGILGPDVVSACSGSGHQPRTPVITAHMAVFFRHQFMDVGCSLWYSRAKWVELTNSRYWKYCNH